jgi:hypothetical protein
MNEKQESESNKGYMQSQKNKIIADFVTGENRQILILFAIDEVKKYRLKNRIKIAFSILRGSR